MTRWAEERRQGSFAESYERVYEAHGAYLALGNLERAAEHCGVSSKTLSRAFKRHGFKIKPAGRPRRKP